MRLKNDCFHGELVWKDSKGEKNSTEHFDGSFPLIYCNIKGAPCMFENYEDCEICAKKDKE